MAHVVVEVDVSNFSHQRYTRADQWSLDEFQIPGSGNRVRLTHPLELLFEVVLLRAPRERELEQPTDVHRGVARLEREPNGIEWGNLPHRKSLRSPGRLTRREAYPMPALPAVATCLLESSTGRTLFEP